MLFLLASLAFAEDMWATAPVDGTRWLDVTTTSVTLGEGDRVEVMVRDGDRVRVRKGTSFGWVPAASLTATAPVKAPELPELPDLSMPEGQE